MSDGTPRKPTVKQRTVECGKRTTIDAYDRDGTPVQYRISAVPPGTPGEPDQNTPGSSVPLPRSSLPPLHALIDVITSGGRQLPGAKDVHVTLNSEAVPGLPERRWSDALACPLGVVDSYERKMTVELPAGVDTGSGQYGMLLLFDSGTD